MIASYRSRGYKEQFLKMVDLDEETVQPLYEEATQTSIDNFNYREIEGWDDLVVLSEREGWKQLYLVNKNSGKITSLTNGEFVVNDIVHIDEKDKVIYYTASGVDAAMNPYHQKLYRVSLKGKIKELTPENANHEITFFEDADYFVDAISKVDQPTKTVLRSKKNGKITATLTTANTAQIEALSLIHI